MLSRHRKAYTALRAKQNDLALLQRIDARALELAEEILTDNPSVESLDAYNLASRMLAAPKNGTAPKNAPVNCHGPLGRFTRGRPVTPPLSTGKRPQSASTAKLLDSNIRPQEQSLTAERAE